jgi:hypothetical protein
MSGVPILEELRPRAFAVAYRMLGSVSTPSRIKVSEQGMVS